MLGYRVISSPSPAATLGHLYRLAPGRIVHRRQQRHPDGEKDPWGRDLDERTVPPMTSWRYAGTGHVTTAERQLALAAAARAREHNQIAREETSTA